MMFKTRMFAKVFAFAAAVLMTGTTYAALSTGHGINVSASDHWGTTYTGAGCIGDGTGGKSGTAGGYRVDNGCVPYVANVDDDGDTMQNTWEDSYYLNKYSNLDRFMDIDSDGSTNAREYSQGTAPTTSTSGTPANPKDTDGDGIWDSEDPNPTSAGSSTFDLNATYKGINIQQGIDAN